MADETDHDIDVQRHCAAPRHRQDSSDLMLTQADGTHSGHRMRPGQRFYMIPVCVEQTLLLRCFLPMNADDLSR